MNEDTSWFALCEKKAKHSLKHTTHNGTIIDMTMVSLNAYTPKNPAIVLLWNIKKKKTHNHLKTYGTFKAMERAMALEHSVLMSTFKYFFVIAIYPCRAVFPLNLIACKSLWYSMLWYKKKTSSCGEKNVNWK